MGEKKRRNPTLKELKFALEYLKRGNGTQAALIAYDTDDPNCARAIASENLTKPAVRAVIEEYAMKAQMRMQELSAQDKHLPTALGASKDILDRAGFKPVEKTQVESLNLNADIEIDPKVRAIKAEYEEKLFNQLTE